MMFTARRPSRPLWPRLLLTSALLGLLLAPLGAQEPAAGPASPEPPAAQPSLLADWVEGLVPEALRQQVFLLPHWKWIVLLLLVLLGVVLDRLIAIGVRGFVRRLGSSQRFRIDEETLKGLERPLSILVISWVLGGGLPILKLEPGAASILDVALSITLAVGGVWTAYRLVDLLTWYLAEKARKSHNTFDDMIVPLMRRTLKIFVVLIAAVWVASRVSGDLWGIFAGVGLGSLALSFAARDSVENLFGTFTVLMDKPFQLGDWIVTGDIEGTVEEVGFRSTRVRTFYNSLISVPNRHFISSTVDNMGKRRYRRIKTTLGLTYDTPPGKVQAFCEGVRQLILEHPYTRKDYFHVYLNAFGSSSLDVLLYCFVETPDWATELREKHRLFGDILRLAERLQVSFAFPTRTLHMLEAEAPRQEKVPDGLEEAAALGRGAASEIAREGLAPFGGKKPPPAG